MQNDNVDESGFTFFTPVPSEQIPVNEYRSLQESRFFRWAILERWKYTTKLLAVWIAGFLFSALVFTTRSTAYNLALSDCLWSIIIANIFVLLSLMRLYAAWHYVYSRLLVNKIDYKSKLKKTAVWEKPRLMQERDNLVARFQIRPVLQRLRQTITSIFLALSLAFLFLIENS